MIFPQFDIVRNRQLVHDTHPLVKSEIFELGRTEHLAHLIIPRHEFVRLVRVITAVYVCKKRNVFFFHKFYLRCGQLGANELAG